MAKVILDEGLIQGISGSLSKGSGYYFRVQNGKTYLCKCKKQCNKRVSALQQKQRDRFGKANKVAKEIMRSTSVLCAYFEGRFNTQKKYKTLRGYICSALMKGEFKNLLEL